jgi:hypothetical protein
MYRQQEKYGRHLNGSSKSVFDGGVFWKKFSRQIDIRDIVVMGWKAVTRQTQRTNPELSTNINLAIEKGSLKFVIKNGFALSPVGIQNSTTRRFASDWLI